MSPRAAREKLESKGINLNTSLMVLSIAGTAWIVARFLVPLEKVPDKVEQIEKNQVIQTTQIAEIYRRLGHIEGNPSAR